MAKFKDSSMHGAEGVATVAADDGSAVADRSIDHVLPAGPVRAHQVARRLQRHQDLQRLRVQGLPGWRQPRRVGRAVDQVDAGPGLQRLDAARKRRLGDVAQLRRAREAARLGQADEILEPLGFHRKECSSAPAPHRSRGGPPISPLNEGARPGTAAMVVRYSRLH